MKAYLDIVQQILDKGEYKPNRTGIGAYTIAGAMFQHDMSEGFPLLTTKQTPFKTMSTELDLFINGITDKKWLQDRKCYIWDEWASPKALEKYPITAKNVEINVNKIIKQYQKDYGTFEKGFFGKGKLLSVSSSPKVEEKLQEIVNSEYFKKKDNWKSTDKADFELAKTPDENLIKNVKLLAQYTERDLGPIYGWQWRHYTADYGYKSGSFWDNIRGNFSKVSDFLSHDRWLKNYELDYKGKGIDQLAKVVDTLKKNPTDRRMIVTAWNPKDVPAMGLPACHYGFQVTVVNDKLNLLWNQRSVDTMLGLPFNIASYALLLHLLAKESGFKEGTLTGFLADVHIYENQVNGAKEQVSRDPKKYALPKVTTENFKSIFEWEAKDSKIVNYQFYPKIDFGKVAV